jgi:hypothetical protein
MTLAEVIAKTKAQMAEITGLETDTVARLDRVEGGWSVAIDMLEHKAIPRTNDLLSSFEVELNQDGDVVRWKRVGRSIRGAAHAQGSA